MVLEVTSWYQKDGFDGGFAGAAAGGIVGLVAPGLAGTVGSFAGGVVGGAVGGAIMASRTPCDDFWKNVITGAGKGAVIGGVGGLAAGGAVRATAPLALTEAQAAFVGAKATTITDFGFTAAGF